MRNFLISLILVASGTLPGATGCPDFTVEAPQPKNGQVVQAVDFGLSVGSERNATAINRALAAAKSSGATAVELAPGTYRCYDEPGVLIEGFSDFVLDGKGAVLVFRRLPEYRGQPQSEVLLDKGNVLVRNCVRTRVGNFTMDWDWATDPPADFMVVRARHIDRQRPENSYLDFDLPDWERHPKYPEPMPMQRMTRMTSDRLHFAAGEHYSFGQTEGHFGAKNEWISPNRLRLWPGIPQPGKNQNPATGFFCPNPLLNLKIVEGVKEGELFRGQHYYYGKNGFCMVGNRHLTVHDVTVWSSFGLAMVTDGPQEYWQVERFRVVPPTRDEHSAAYPGRRYFSRPITSTADGHHVVRSKGHAKYVDCEWTLNNDDSSNFHDRFTIGVKCGARKIQIVNKRGNAYFRAEPGATIELRKANFETLGFMARLVAVYDEILELDREVPDQSGPCFLIWDRTYGTDNVLLRGCKFTDACNRNLFSPSNLTIEDCAFVRQGWFPIQLVSEYRANLWCEGTGTTNVVIRNCRFEDPGSQFPGIPVISSACTTPPGWEVPPPPEGFVAGDVLIEECAFVRPTGPIVDFPSGKDVVCSNLTVDLTGVDTNRFPQAGKIRVGGACR